MKKLLSLFSLLCFSLILFAQGNTQGLQAKNEIPLDDIVKRDLVKQKPLLEYAPIREADILWEKRIWRVIDTREKMNLPFRYPKKPFFSILYDGIENGDITAFSTEDDHFGRALEIDELRDQLYETDTILTFDPITYDPITQIITNDPDIDDIKRFRVKELWYFDSKTSTLKVRILGIAPLMERYDDNGNYIGEMPLFWVSYQQSRPYLARHEVFNAHNDRGLMTWDDLFEMRYFSSHIYKESNVHDQRLQDYLSGTDLLLEADKIKSTIFNWEHDLWSY